jgi:hypothetical protein
VQVLHTVLLPRAASAEALVAGGAEVGREDTPRARRERDPTPAHPAVPDFVQVSASCAFFSGLQPASELSYLSCSHPVTEEYRSIFSGQLTSI